MQRVTNCVFLKDDKVLLLKKPRRNWWVAPGGKMEQGESVKDACVREYREETGIYLHDPVIKGIFTFIMKDGDQIISEWMMFTFFATEGDGIHRKVTEEGTLSWQPVKDIQTLPMAEGDYHILDYMIYGKGILYGTFTYTPEFELLSYRLDPS